MKIKCSFCGNMINDTLEQCPYCDGINENVRRKVNDQPSTIDELKEWYKLRGLPASSITRFFIGENYKGTRAFGIYYDKDSKNYIVYKNKENGERAIRYEGKDEAYAVNELYQRLKQEILQQKQFSIGGTSKKNNSSSQSKSSKTGSASVKFIDRLLPSAYTNPLVKLLVFILDLFLGGFLAFLALLAFIMILGSLITMFEPEDGYYIYKNNAYYKSPLSYNNCEWYSYDSENAEWSDGLSEGRYPSVFEKKSSAKEYFVSDSYSSELPCSDFTKSLAYKDIQAGQYIKTGYYKYDDGIYYHLTEDYTEGWYYYDDDYGEWSDIDNSSLPEDFSHTSVVQDFYYTPVWNSSTQFTDFTDTNLYEEDKDNWSDSDSSDDSYDWDSSDSWDSDSTDWSSDW